MDQETQGLPVLSFRASIKVCGFVSSSMTKEWTTAGSLLKKESFVFAAWPLITGKKDCRKTCRCRINQGLQEEL